MILQGGNLDSAGPDDYRIEIGVDGCVATFINATEIHCQPDLSSVTELVTRDIKVNIRWVVDCSCCRPYFPTHHYHSC